jgi:hypothetical protein
MTHLDTYNTSYGQKKGQESNWHFDSRPLKVKSTRFPYIQVTCNIPLKTLDKGYNFALDFILIGGLQTKLWAPKVAGVLVQEFRNSQMGIPRQNAI